MSRADHFQQYIDLMRQFLAGHIDVHQFEVAYMKLWKADRDEGWAVFDALYKDQIVTSADFDRFLHQYVEAQSPNEKMYSRLIDHTFTTLDLYSSEPSDPWEIDETELRREVKDVVDQIEAWLTR